MRAPRRFTFVLISLLFVAPLIAQKEPRHPLTETQIEQIRDAGIDPDGRIKLYTQFLDDRVDTIKGLISRSHTGARVRRLDDELQDMTALMDELGANLDQYGERKADLRKSLKALNEDTSRWRDVLNSLPTEPGFDLSRTEAIDSVKDLSDQVGPLLKEQTDYFNLHKDEKGQQRAEPQSQ